MLENFFNSKHKSGLPTNNNNSSNNCPHLQRQQQQDDKQQQISSNSNLVEMMAPASHKGFSADDKEKCPYFQIQQKIDNDSNNNNNSVLPEKKVKKPKGGCPFMPSEKKKNPALGPLSEAYNVAYISPYNYLLDYKGIDAFSSTANPSRSIKQKRERFDKYPIYLKHSLFHEEESMQKVRRCDVSQKFFVYDQFRERGNKLFTREQYSDAVLCYERALGVFKWLEIVDEEEIELQKFKEQKEQKEKQKFQNSSEALQYIQQKIDTNKQLEEENQLRLLRSRQDQQQQQQQQQDQQLTQSQTMVVDEDTVSQHSIRSDEAIDDDEDYQEREKQSMKEDLEVEMRQQQIEDLMEEEEADENETTVILDKHENQKEKLRRRQQAEQIQKMRDEEREIKKKYKTLLTTYTDDNVRLCDGESLTDASDIDMRKSMLMTVYINLAVAYMKLHYFQAARVALADAMLISDKSSQAFYRKSQAIAYDKSSSLKELYQAKEDIERAINLKNYEKMFNGEQNMLKILNLANHKEAYIDQAHFVVNRIEQLKRVQNENLCDMFEREREIEEIYQDMLKNGQLPQEEEDGDDMQILELREEQNEQMEIEVVKTMIQKYYDLIDFYQEAQKPEKAALAKQEIQTLMEVYSEIKFYHELDFEQQDNNNNNSEAIQSANKEYGIDFKNKKSLKRLLRLKREKVREAYESQHFNFDMFNYALKEYFRKKEEKEKQIKQRQRIEDICVPKHKKRSFLESLFSLEAGAQLILLVILILGVVFLNKHVDNPFKQILSLNKKQQ